MCKSIHTLYMRDKCVLDRVPARISNLETRLGRHTLYMYSYDCIFFVFCFSCFFIGAIGRQDIMSYMAACFCQIYV